MEQVLARAGASLESRDYKQASLLAGQCQEKIKALKEQARPVITLSFSRMAFEPETWDDLVIRVVNKGSAHAEAVSLSFPRRAEVEFLEELGLLMAGEEAELHLRFKPLERGKVPLNIGISFRDLEGKQYSSRQTVDIWVGREREPERPDRRKEPEMPHLRDGPSWEASYQRLKPIGSGGFSDVFLARRKSHGEKVALKFPRGFVRGVDTVSPEISLAFQREADLWKKLKHEHIVQLLDFGFRSLPWMAMEYMGAGTLADRLGKLPLRLTLQIFLSICSALELAHEGGVVHNDIKPENILFNEREVPKLGDWGSARHKLFSSFSRDSSGTFLYYAPEQAYPQRFGPYGHAGDVFQLGMIFYEALCGRHPFLLEGGKPSQRGASHRAP